MKSPSSSDSWATRVCDRRRFLATTIGIGAIAPVTAASAQAGAQRSGSLTKERRDRMTPAEVLDAMKKGNERFRSDVEFVTEG